MGTFAHRAILYRILVNMSIRVAWEGNGARSRLLMCIPGHSCSFSQRKVHTHLFSTTHTFYLVCLTSVIQDRIKKKDLGEKEVQYSASQILQIVPQMYWFSVLIVHGYTLGDDRNWNPRHLENSRLENVVVYRVTCCILLSGYLW